MKPKRPMAGARWASPPRPGRNLGLGRDLLLPPGLISARKGPGRWIASNGLPLISGTQNPRPARPLCNPSPICAVALSLFSLPFLSQSAAQQQGRRRRAAPHGSRAAAGEPFPSALLAPHDDGLGERHFAHPRTVPPVGPLAGARVRPLQGAPPSSGSMVVLAACREGFLAGLNNTREGKRTAGPPPSLVTGRVSL